MVLKLMMKTNKHNHPFGDNIIKHRLTKTSFLNSKEITTPMPPTILITMVVKVI